MIGHKDLLKMWSFHQLRQRAFEVIDDEPSYLSELFVPGRDAGQSKTNEETLRIRRQSFASGTLIAFNQFEFQTFIIKNI